MVKLRVRTVPVPTPGLTSTFHTWHSATYHCISYLCLQFGCSPNHTVREAQGVGVNLQMRTRRPAWSITPDRRPPAYTKLYSLFTEAAELAQDSVEDVLMVISQVCLQQSGQCTLLHPHLKPTTEGQGSSSSSFHPSLLCRIILFVSYF